MSESDINANIKKDKDGTTKKDINAVCGIVKMSMHFERWNHPSLYY